jgi:hypothetical protein
MAKRSGEGANRSTAARLSLRGEGGLYRKEMAGGGEVFSGPTATRALRAVGARAFTMDNNIFVSEDFDANRKAEDAALYAHEQHHQLNSGGEGAARSFHDAEELAARAIERMVLHRASEGEDFGTVLRDVQSARIQREADVVHLSGKGSGSSGPTGSGSQSTQREDEAAKAFAALLQQGRDERSILMEFADEIVHTLVESRLVGRMNGKSVGFI